MKNQNGFHASTGVLNEKNHFQCFNYITKNLVLPAERGFSAIKNKTSKNPARTCLNSLNHGKTLIIVKSVGLKEPTICAYCYMSYARTRHELIMYVFSAKFNLS